jgi:hypothetical protein
MNWIEIDGELINLAQCSVISWDEQYIEGYLKTWISFYFGDSIHRSYFESREDRDRQFDSLKSQLCYKQDKDEK